MADSDDAKRSEAASQQDEDLRQARRTLLKAALYVPPAIIGTLMIPRDARAQPAPSCNPQGCGPAPCTPWQCNPAYCEPDQCDPHDCTPNKCGPEICTPGR